MAKRWIVALVGALAVSPACERASARPPVQGPGLQELPPPGYLSPVARDVIRSRMGRHGGDMTRVLWAAVLLDYGEVAEFAGSIEAEPMLARPRPGDSESLNTELPSRYFDLQDDLRERASAVKKAALQRSSDALGKAFGRLSETCIACHATYMYGPKAKLPLDAR